MKNKIIFIFLISQLSGDGNHSSILSINNNFLPPTIHYETPDPECDLNYIPNKSIQMDVKYIMSNAFGFGGHNASLIFKAYS